MDERAIGETFTETRAISRAHGQIKIHEDTVTDRAA